MADRVLLSQEEARALLARISSQTDLSEDAYTGLQVLTRVAQGKGAAALAAFEALGEVLRPPAKQRVSTLVDDTEPFGY